jgi:hypothetical protein
VIEYWILDKDHNIVAAKDVYEWGDFFQKPDRIVAKDEINGVRISTVFLGIDHGFERDFGHPDAQPILLETMIFGGEHDRYQDRCATWAEAEAMHAKALAMVNP